MPAQDNVQHGLIDSFYTSMSCYGPLSGTMRPRHTGRPARLLAEGLDSSWMGPTDPAAIEVAVVQRAADVIGACDWLGRDPANLERVRGLPGQWHWIDLLADLCELRGVVELPAEPGWAEQRELLSQLLEDAILAVERLAELTACAETLAS